MTAASLAATSIITDAPNGAFLVKIPVMLCMEVDPLDGVTREESGLTAAERLLELPIHVTIGGVPIEIEFAKKS